MSGDAGGGNRDRQQAIAALLTAHVGRPVEVDGLRAYGGGCINDAVRVSSTAGSFFAKWSEAGSRGQLEVEAIGLRALRAAAGDELVVPEVIGVTSPPDPPILVLEHLDPPPRGDDAAQDAALGAALAQIHAHTAERFGRLGEEHDSPGAEPATPAAEPDWVSHYRDSYMLPLLRRIAAERPLPEEVAGLHRRLCERLPAVLGSGEEADRPALVHGDLWHGNYMRTARGPALIDPHAAYAHREYEFGIATLFGGFGRQFWDAYQSVAPLAPGWQERNALYQWYHLLNHHRLFGGSYGAAAEATARRFL